MKAGIKELEFANCEDSIQPIDSNIPHYNERSAHNLFGGRNAAKKAKISKFVTHHRYIQRVRNEDQGVRTPKERAFSRTKLDSHADTTVAGGNCTLISDTDRRCSVSPHFETYKPVNDVPIVTIATGYTARDAREYILIINESLWMPNLNHI